MRARSFNAQDYANTVWAFAKLGQFDEPLFSAFATKIKRRLHSHDDFNAQGLSNTVWGFAKAGHLDDALFKALAAAIQRR